MKTWSLQGISDRVTEFLGALERITRPPRLGHDWDEDVLGVSPVDCDEDDDALWVHPRDLEAEHEADVDYVYKALFDCTPEDRMLALTVECTYCGAPIGDQCMIDGRPIPMMFPGSGGMHASRIKRSHCFDGAEGLAEREAEEEVSAPSPRYLIGCVVDDCPHDFASYDELNTHSYWNHLQPNPFHKSEDPLVTYHRYPGADGHGDFKWFPVKLTRPAAFQFSAGGSAREDPADGPAEVDSFPSSPSAGSPDDAGAEWIGWAVPAISTSLDEHKYGFGHDTNCACGAPGIYDWSDWLDHAAPRIAAHLQQAAYPPAPQVETGHDHVSHAAELFPQHTNQKGTQ